MSPGPQGGVHHTPGPWDRRLGASARASARGQRQGQRQGPAPGASAKGAGSWGSPGGLIGPHGAFCHFIVERWCYPEAPGRLRGARGRVTTPTPRGRGKKTKKSNFSRFFFLLRGGSGGGLGGSPGFPGAPRGPWGAQGGPGEPRGGPGPDFVKNRIFIKIGLKIGRRHRPKAF